METSELKHFQEKPERLWDGRAEFLETMCVGNEDGKGIVPHPSSLIGDRILYYSASSDRYFNISETIIDEELNYEGWDISFPTTELRSEIQLVTMD